MPTSNWIQPGNLLNDHQQVCSWALRQASQACYKQRPIASFCRRCVSLMIISLWSPFVSLLASNNVLFILNVSFQLIAPGFAQTRKRSYSETCTLLAMARATACREAVAEGTEMTSPWLRICGVHPPSLPTFPEANICGSGCASCVCHKECRVSILEVSGVT